MLETYPNCSDFHRKLDQRLRAAKASPEESKDIALYIEGLRRILIVQDFKDEPDEIIEGTLKQADVYAHIPTQRAFLEEVDAFLEREKELLGTLRNRIGKAVMDKAKALFTPDFLRGADPYFQKVFVELRNKRIPSKKAKDFLKKMIGYCGKLNCFQTDHLADPVACQEEVARLTTRFPEDLRKLFIEKLMDFNLHMADEIPEHTDDYWEINQELKKVLEKPIQSSSASKENSEFTSTRKQVLVLYYLNRLEKFPSKKRPISKSNYISFLQCLLNRNEDNLRKKYYEYHDWPNKEMTMADLKNSPRKGNLFYSDLQDVKKLFEDIGLGDCARAIQADIDKYLPFLKS